MHRPAISGTGVFTPTNVITNDALVEAYNAYADRINAKNEAAIASGQARALPKSSSDFIVQASGIENRFVMDAAGVLDPEIMHPILRERSDDEPGLMAEMALDACAKALQHAGVEAKDVDAVICAASNHERPYPAIAVEIQNMLGCGGFGFDMNVACSSATFGIQAAADMIRAGTIRKALVVSPEICSAHLDWRDRDCHFIFGDVCTAVLLEREADAAGAHFTIRSTRCETQFSNNIRNNNGFLRRTRPGHMEDRRDMLFMQEGRKVFKQVLPMVSAHMACHMEADGIDPSQLKRIWLHQANKAMNDFIGRKVFGRVPTPQEQPNILKDYANTSSAGSIIAFSHNSDDLSEGDIGMICSFGAGYSVGSIIVERKLGQREPAASHRPTGREL